MRSCGRPPIDFLYSEISAHHHRRPHATARRRHRNSSKTSLRQGGGAKKIDKQHRDGKLTARERIAQLIDPGTMFLEIGLLIAYDQYDGQAPAAGVVTGLGKIEGRPAVIVANDATVKAGAWWPETITKILRAQEIAMRNRAAHRVSGGLGRRESALSGRNLSRPVRRGADLLLQLAHAPQTARSADRRCHGAVHRRRRVSSGV